MNKMYDILEKCLVEIEQGANIDTVLFRYPEFADELRPILETSIKAMDMARDPSIAVVHINRIKLLQRAAELREAKVKRSSRFWTVSLRRLVVTVLVLIALFASGNGLVRASSNTIPGDNLYPVKRTWEDVLLLFTFNTQQREEMEFEHENERLEELSELFAEGRSVKVDFAGYVTRLTTNEWRVSAITVVISPQTVLPNQQITVGIAVRVIGQSQSDHTVLAERIEILPSNIKLPEIQDDEPEIEQEHSNGSNQSGEQESTSGSENEAPQIGETNTPESESVSGSDETEPHDSQSSPDFESESGITTTPDIVFTPQATETNKTEFEIQSVSFKGELQAINDNTWTVNGRTMNVSRAEIHGKPVIGATVKVEGYYNSSGAFIAKDIEVLSGSSDNTKDTSEHNDD